MDISHSIIMRYIHDFFSGIENFAPLDFQTKAVNVVGYQQWEKIDKNLTIKKAKNAHFSYNKFQFEKLPSLIKQSPTFDKSQFQFFYKYLF